MSGSNNGSGSIWTPANIVTCIRVVFVPVWLLLAETVGGSGAGGLVVFFTFCLLSLTDKLDGYLARSRGEVTTFGKFLDPIADKLVVIVALSYLLEIGWVSSWVLLVVVAREFLVSGLRMVVASEGIVVAASNLGKWKTATTMVSICGLLLCVALNGSPLLQVLSVTQFVNVLTIVVGLFYVSELLLLVAVVLTVWSGVDYFVKSWPVLSRGAETEGDADAQAAAGDDERALMGGGSSETTAPGNDEQDGDTHEEGAGSRVSSPNASVASGAAPTWADCVTLSERVLERARAAKLTVGTAESCTGGLVEGALTAVPGSSDVVMGAVGSYACSVKESILGVENEVLATVGAVSSECAAQMAEGARTALGCELAVSTTGIAGPGGAVPGKPVGLVWFGVSDGTHTHTESKVFPGDRAEVRVRTVMHALSLLEKACDGTCF